MILIYTTKTTRRISYIFKLIFKELLKTDFRITNSIEEFQSSSLPKISYSHHPIGDELFFFAHDLLFENGINDQHLVFVKYDNVQVFFPVYEHHAAMPFDPFAASFFLVSRYEEYLPFIKDEYDRFTPQDSIAYKNNFLHKPVINIWAAKIAKIIHEKFPDLIFTQRKYKFIPTIDIDLAYSYMMKGLVRTLGGYIKSIYNWDMDEFRERTNVLRGKQKDPFDTYDYLISIHQEFKLEPIFFILFSQYGQYDKNISTENKKFQSLIKLLADYGEVGIHPSFASNTDGEKLKDEIRLLSRVLHTDVTKSRQHFLKLVLPDTYRNLIKYDITDDYSMGYASEGGFRAGISDSFNFFDLDMDSETNLRIHPFAIMDGTLKDYKRVNASQAIEEIKQLVDEVKAVNGTFISLWHNESLSEQKRWKGWRYIYKDMIKYARSDD